MSKQDANNSPSREFREHWVNPFYRKLPFAFLNPDCEDDLPRFTESVRQALEELDGQILDTLLGDQVGWREHSVGSWFVGAGRLEQYLDVVGELLLASQFTYSGRSHCFALAALGTDKARDYLERYLQTYLPKTDCWYDQGWALAAIKWLDSQEGVASLARFIPEWERFVADKPRWNLEANHATLRKLLVYCRDAF